MHADRFALRGAVAVCVLVFGIAAAEASLRLTVLKTEGAYGSAIYGEMPNGRNLWINGGSALGTQTEAVRFLDATIGAGGTIWYALLTHGPVDDGVGGLIEDDAAGLRETLDRRVIMRYYSSFPENDSPSQSLATTEYSALTSRLDTEFTAPYTSQAACYEIVTTANPITTAKVSGPGANLGPGWDSSVDAIVVSGEEMSAATDPRSNSVAFHIWYGSNTILLGADTDQEATLVSNYAGVGGRLKQNVQLYWMHGHGANTDSTATLLDAIIPADRRRWYAFVTEGSTEAATDLTSSALGRIRAREGVVYRNGLDHRVRFATLGDGEWGMVRRYLYSEGGTTAHPDVCAPPTAGALSAPSPGGGTGTVNLSWAAASTPGGTTLTRYDVYRATLAGGVLIPLAQPATWWRASSVTGIYRKVGSVAAPGTTHQDTGLTVAARYFYRVRPIHNYYYEGELSGEQAGEPYAPSALSATDAGINLGISLSWSVVTDPVLTDYRVYRSTQAGVTLVSSHVVTAILSPGTTHRDERLSAGTTYYYRVTARTSFETVGSPESWAVPSDTIPPSALTNLSGSPGTNDQEVRLTWTAPGDNGTIGSAWSYAIRHSTLDVVTVGWNNMTVWKDTRAAVAVQGAPETELITGLIRGTTYYFVVRARDFAGNLAAVSNNPSAPAQDVPPLAPVGLSALRNSGGASVSLSWSASPEPDLGEYRIYRSTLPGGLAGKAFRTPVPAGGQTFVDQPVAVEMLYYQVTARDARGHESGGSSEVPVSPGDVNPPAPPNGLTAIRDPAGNRITLAWTNPPDIDFASTMIRFKTAGYPVSSTDGALLYSGTATGLAHPGLANGTTYFYAAFAHDGVPNFSAPTTAQALAQDDGPPNAVPDLSSLTGATEGLVTLTWTSPGDTGTLGNAAAYQLRYATAPFGEANWAAPWVAPLTGLSAPQAQGNGELRSFFFTATATFYFALKAVDDEGFVSAIDSRSASDAQAWAVPYATPTAPLFLSAAGVSTSSVRVTWQDRSNLEDRYAVYLTSSPVDLNVSGSLPPDAASWDATGLKANAVGIPSAGATVRAFKGAASSRSGSFGGLYSLPHAPADLFSPSQSGGSITLAWRDPAGGAPGPGGDFNASRYGVEIANSALGPWTPARGWADLVTSTGTMVTGLAGGSNYYVRVLGYNANGTEGGRSGVVSVWTRPAEVTTAAPGGVGATSTSDRRVKITWTANLEPDLAGYKLYRREGTGEWIRLLAAALGTAATFYEDTFPLTTAVFPVYVYAVASLNTQGGESARSPSPGVTVRIERQYADVSGRGALAVYDLGTGAYTDPIGRSSPLRAVTNADDGVFGFFVDLNGDGQADAYWAPMTGAVGPVASDDVDGNGVADLLYRSNPGFTFKEPAPAPSRRARSGSASSGPAPWPARHPAPPPDFDHYWDGTLSRNLGRVAVVVRDANSGAPLVGQVGLVMASGGVVRDAGTDGRFSSPLGSMRGKPASLWVTREGYVSWEREVVLEQGSLANTLVVDLVPTGVDPAAWGLLTYPNPAPAGRPVTIVYNVPAAAGGDAPHPSVQVFSDQGAYLATIADGASGLQTAVWTPADEQGRALGPGLYYAILKSGVEKRIWKIVIAP